VLSVFSQLLRLYSLASLGYSHWFLGWVSGRLQSSLRRSSVWLSLGLAFSLLLGSPIYSAPDSLNVRVNRWLEVQQISGMATHRQGERSRTARVGDRLQSVGDSLVTAADSTATLAVDTQIGTIEVAENTSVLVKALETTPSDGRITRLQVDRGRVQLRIRPFTNPDSRLEIETPAGVSGVRGTEFGVVISPTGKMGVATLEGSVVTNAQGEEVAVPAGFQNVTLPGEPPTQPVPFTNQPNLEYQVERIIRRSIRRIVVNGQVDPTSTVLIKGEPQEIDREGRFSLLLPAPSRLRLTVTVITPLGQEQSYDLELI
jgi:FecR protein